MRRNVTFILILCFYVTGVFARPAFAAFKLLDAIKEFGERRYLQDQPERLHVGPVRVHPTLRTKFEYDSNILYEESDAREDVIFTVSPGVILEIPVDKHQLSVGYEADIETFFKNRHRNQNDQNQTFFALADLDFNHVYINVLDNLIETSSRSGTTFGERYPRLDHYIYPRIGFRWNRFILEQGFRHFSRNFRRSVDTRLDFQNVDWTSVAYYKLTARTKILAEYQYGQVDYDDDYERQLYYNQFRVGIVGEIIPNLLMKFRTGIHMREYTEAGQPDLDDWVVQLVLEYKMREDLTFKVKFERSPIEATWNNVNYYIRHDLRLGVDYSFLPKWAIYSKLRYNHDAYAERATVGARTGFRHDDRIILDNGLRYEPRDWMEFEINYRYMRKDSNFSTSDYTDHRLSLTSSIIY